MIKLDSFEVNAENIKKVIDLFTSSELPRLEKLWAYYSANNDILNKSNSNNNQKNALNCAYAKYITKLQTGYFMGIPVKFNSSDESYLKEYKAILDDNFINDVNYEMAKSAGIYGYSVEMIYQNEKSKTKIKKLDPKETIIIFGTKMDEFLHTVIRYYKACDVNGNITEIATVYTNTSTQYFYKKANEDKFVENIEQREINLFDEIPVVIYKNNEEMKSDFEDIINLNNAYDKSQSNTANDVDYFNDAYMVISGSNDITDDDEINSESKVKSTAEKMRQNKLMYFPDGGDAKFLVKDINDAATENYKTRLDNDIHKFSMTPNLADEKFAGNLSGIAIKFKTIPLEENATEKENKFRVGLRKRCEIVTSMINKIKNTDYIYTDIIEEFTRNLPVNEIELTNTILGLSSYISHRTLLELLPQIDNVDDELKRIEQEKDEYDKRDFEIVSQEEKNKTLN